MIFALGGQSELRQDHAVQRPDRLQPARGQFPRCDSGSEDAAKCAVQKDCSVVDLPGIYSLAHLTRRRKSSPGTYILNQKPDGIINIVDATNIERNLYSDAAVAGTAGPHGAGAEHDGRGARQRRHHRCAEADRRLWVFPVVPITAAKGEGVVRTDGSGGADGRRKPCAAQGL